MTIPADIADQITELGEETARCEWILKTHGELLLRGFVAKLKETAGLFNEWHPRLVEFARQKRQSRPLPEPAAWDALTLAQHRILKPLIENAERVPIRGHFTSAIFSAPFSSLQLLLCSWPAEVPSAVFLTPKELQEWNKICEPPREALWWFALQWWNIESENLEKSRWFCGVPPAVPRGVTPLLVTYGMDWGDLAGGEKADLWTWDGQRERFVKNVGIMDY